jgi:hypothetical protein
MSAEENHTTREPEEIPSADKRPQRRLKAQRFFEEQGPKIIEAAPRDLRRLTRRDLLLFGAGSLGALAGIGYLLPQDTLGRLGVYADLDSPQKERFLNGALRFDDDVAEALTRQTASCPRTANRRSRRSGTTTTELLPILAIFLDGI